MAPRPNQRQPGLRGPMDESTAVTNEDAKNAALGIIKKALGTEFAKEQYEAWRKTHRSDSGSAGGGAGMEKFRQMRDTLNDNIKKAVPLLKLPMQIIEGVEHIGDEVWDGLVGLCRQIGRWLTVSIESVKWNPGGESELTLSFEIHLHGKK